ncbi:hypothetical protein MIND_00295500 [Mycena indigotica]|uniref:Uncharacterized protein n=1 Tax=Mycena indigotica TaxID=2126181 RepID=A0A8H6T3K5_9AGAR|nr:uncharacterized protein MIND_00295500 [Mycena indigotica]KAF7309252.1 hypothetical protein MIND_00295500 [Mycena indigotica]
MGRGENRTGPVRWRGILVLSLPWAIVVLLLISSPLLSRISGPVSLVPSPLPGLTNTHPCPSVQPLVQECPPPPPPSLPPPQQPPLFELYHARERQLPQHNLAAPFPDGNHAKYLWVDNHGFSFGWGNYMQEMLLNAYLAYAADRAYVFDNYTWMRDGPEVVPWPVNGRLIPARIPLSAFISGPLVGDRMPSSSPRAAAISQEWYHQVCPESERVVLDTRTIQDTFAAPPTAKQIIERWTMELHNLTSRCVELSKTSPRLFHDELIGTDRVLDIFPSLSASPILQNFSWSPLIFGEFLANSHHFLPSSFNFTSHTLLAAILDTELPIPGLLVLHVRRGDYEIWCPEAVANGLAFTGFNRFPQLSDKSPAPNALSRCLPSIQDIANKVRDVVSDQHAAGLPPLTRVYVMTNAKNDWLASLAEALRAIQIWKDGIGTSRELSLSWEGRHVSQTVDMVVAQRAEVFVGNGFSSLTSNIVMLRMHNPKLDPRNIRFW